MTTTTTAPAHLVHALMRRAWNAHHKTATAATAENAATAAENAEAQAANPNHEPTPPPYTPADTDAAYAEAERRRGHAAAAAQQQRDADHDTAEQLADAWTASLRKTQEGASLRLAERQQDRQRRWNATGRQEEKRAALAELLAANKPPRPPQPPHTAATALQPPLRERRQPYHAHPAGAPCPPGGC